MYLNDRLNRLLRIPHKLHHLLAASSKNSFNSSHAHSIDKITGQSEWNCFRGGKLLALFKCDACKVKGKRSLAMNQIFVDMATINTNDEHVVK